MSKYLIFWHPILYYAQICHILSFSAEISETLKFSLRKWLQTNRRTNWGHKGHSYAHVRSTNINHIENQSKNFSKNIAIGNYKNWGRVFTYKWWKEIAGNLKYFEKQVLIIISTPGKWLKTDMTTIFYLNHSLDKF